MSQLYVHRNQVKQGNESLEIAFPMVNDYYCFDSYKVLAHFISEHCFSEEHEWKSTLPFEREFEIWKESFEADHLNLDYDLFIASLSEYDYQTICEEYKDELQIEYRENIEEL